MPSERLSGRLQNFVCKCHVFTRAAAQYFARVYLKSLGNLIVTIILTHSDPSIVEALRCLNSTEPTLCALDDMRIIPDIPL